MAHLSLSLFGPMQATLGGRPVAGFESAKVRALLAYLALEADCSHGRDELAGLLWPDEPDQAARANLRNALGNLRQAIADQSAQPPFLSITRDTVQFNVESDHSLDVNRFVNLLAACRQHVHRHIETCRSCAQRLQEAVELYRGDLLSQLFLDDSPTFEEWELVKREELHQQMLEGLYWLASFHEQCGDYEQARRYSARQLELEPWREEAHRQVMRALALSGQRSAALAQYKKCCHMLAQELKADPSEETTRLYHQIKSGDLKHGYAQHNLPTPLTPLVGREQELLEIDQLLENPSCRLLTLTGPGGIGKTRLALAAAAEQVGKFAHGVYFVSLAPLNSANYIVPAIAHAIGLTFSGPQDDQFQLFKYMRDKEMLVVLDNFEHLMEGVNLLTETLKQVSGLTLVVTSRERSNLYGEWILDIHGLSFPQSEMAQTAQTDTYGALKLFVQSARRIQSSFSLSDTDRSCVVRLCRIVAGMPLAIELAASWIRTLSCDEITQQIEQDLGVLATSLRDVPERHRSMQAVFDYSWNLLLENERRALRRLSVFRGGFTRQVAKHVAGASSAVLAALVDKSLLRRAPRGDGRFDLHELIRQYAFEKLRESGELMYVNKHHLEFFLKLAEEIEPKLQGKAQTFWLERLETEHDNLRAALRWSVREEEDAALGVRLGAALSYFWLTYGHLAEGRRWLEATLGRSDDTVTTWRAKALWGAGELAGYQGDLATSRSFFEASVAIFRELGNMPGLTNALYGLSSLMIIQGDLVTARSLLEESLAISRTLGPFGKRGAAYALQMMGMLAHGQGEWMAARAVLEESLTMFRDLVDKQGLALAMGDLGMVLAKMGDHVAGRSILEEGMDIAQDLGSKFSVARTAWGLGYVARAEGNYALARYWDAQAITLSKEYGNVWSIPYVLSALGDIAVAESHYERAAKLLGAAKRICDDFGAPLVPDERTRHEQSVVAVRANLGEEGFSTAWTGGWAMTLEQAIAYALAAEDETH